MPVVLLIAAVVIVIALVLVAAGHGGELSVERNDYAPLDLGPVSATDIALLRPPTALWGYNVQATDEAMTRIAESIRERDVRIVALEQLVTDLSREPAPQLSPYVGARRRRALPAEVTQPAEAARPAAEVTQPAEAVRPAQVAWPTEPVAWPTEGTRAAGAARPGEAERPAKPDRPKDAGWPDGEGQVGPQERSRG